MAMNPRTHPRGVPPDFSMQGLPANPNSQRITTALWWLVCMRLELEPLSENGGVFANKDGYHNAGENLEDHGLGDPDTDHSIRRAPDRAGVWWREFASAHDWTFDRAHSGNYTEINRYMKRRVDAMRSLEDLRPDDVYAYTIGNLDGDVQVEGWNEYKDAPETGDQTHLWHIHDSFRRNIIGSFWAMWKALTIDMGWTYAEWQHSVAPQPAPEETMDWNDKIKDGDVGDTGGDWRTFRQEAADTQNLRNWQYVGEDSTTPVNPPPPGSRIALLHRRTKETHLAIGELATDVTAAMVVTRDLAVQVGQVAAQAQANGTSISSVLARIGEVDNRGSSLSDRVDQANLKLEQILTILQAPAPE